MAGEKRNRSLGQKIHSFFFVGLYSKGKGINFKHKVCSQKSIKAFNCGTNKHFKTLLQLLTVKSGFNK